MDNRQRNAPLSERTPKFFNQNRDFKNARDKTSAASRKDGVRFQNRNENFKDGADPNRERGFARQNKSVNPNGEKFQTNERFAASRGKNFKPKWERDAAPLARIVSELQITDGKHRGKYVQSEPPANNRPTARRIRETMFRILHRRVRANRFLDLCAGSGMVGLEAISRGALLATFVERSAKRCSLIRNNMEACGVKTGHGEVVEAEAAPFLKRMEKRRRCWDVVYYDPPLDADYDEVLNFFARGAALKTRGVLVIEHHAEMFFPETLGALRRWRVLAQGETSLSFYEKK